MTPFLFHNLKREMSVILGIILFNEKWQNKDLSALTNIDILKVSGNLGDSYIFLQQLNDLGLSILHIMKSYNGDQGPLSSSGGFYREVLLMFCM